MRSLTQSELFALLSDPLVVRLLELICDRDHELSSLLAGVRREQAPDAPSALARLRRAGLVELHRTGAEVVATLSAPSVANVLASARIVLHECQEHEDRPRIIDLDRHSTPERLPG